MEKKVIKNDVISEFCRRGVFGILEIDDVNDAVPAAKALIDGGVTAIELALRTEAAIPSALRISHEVPKMLICAGTVIFGSQVKAAQESGCSMGVAPGLNLDVVKAAKENNFPFVPGVATASELESALGLGCRVVKLFPCEPIGGVSYLNTMMAPYRYLNLRVIPLGGISEANFVSWASNEYVCALGGTWISPRALIRNHAWAEITDCAMRARKIWESVTEKRLGFNSY